jgi:hypothetical protein
MARPLVVFHHGPSRDFFGAFAVFPRPSRGFFDMLVHPLFLLSDTFGAFSSSRHNNLFWHAARKAPGTKKIRHRMNAVNWGNLPMPEEVLNP